MYASPFSRTSSCTSAAPRRRVSCWFVKRPTDPTFGLYSLTKERSVTTGIRSLAFATDVNRKVSMSINRALQKGSVDDSCSAQQLGVATARIYKLLWEGQYLDSKGKRVDLKGDISQISEIIGVTPMEKALLQNYRFMSSRLPGTRQIRNGIRHMVFSSRIFYGLPVFLSFTPGERHSGLTVHLL